MKRNVIHYFLPALLVGLIAMSGSRGTAGDRKSTRLNSSHLGISYAVFCLKKKNEDALADDSVADDSHDDDFVDVTDEEWVEDDFSVTAAADHADDASVGCDLRPEEHTSEL